MRTGVYRPECTLEVLVHLWRQLHQLLRPLTLHANLTLSSSPTRSGFAVEAPHPILAAGRRLRLAKEALLPDAGE